MIPGNPNYLWTVPLALFGWIPIVLLLFTLAKPRTSIIAAFVLGWLLLPVASYRLPGFPVFTKVAAVSLSALLAMLVYDSARLARFRPNWIDFPMLVWCFSPSISVLANGLGEAEAFLRLVDQVLMWGGPYLMGRLYFGTPAGARDLSVGILLGGALYVPLCLFEIRMSPQLHEMLYGFYQHQFLQSIREGGYRPTVFLQHGLAVGLWMSCSAVVGTWIWRRRAVTRVVGVPVVWIACSVTIVALLCKSFGAISLLFLGLIVMTASRMLKSRALLLVLAFVAPIYIEVRATGQWSGESLIQAASSIDSERGDSLRTRVTSEDLLAARARQQPIVGWGGFGRNMEVVDHDRGVGAIPDGFWIIVFGKFGILGIASMTTALLLPVLVIILRTHKRFLFGVGGAPALTLCMIVIMFQIDSLFNAMENPLYVVAAGGLAGLTQGGLDAWLPGAPFRQARLRGPGSCSLVDGEATKGGRDSHPQFRPERAT